MPLLIIMIILYATPPTTRVHFITEAQNYHEVSGRIEADRLASVQFCFYTRG